MTSETNHSTYDVPSLKQMRSWMFFAGVNTIGFFAYAASLPFVATDALPHLLIASLAIIGLAPLMVRWFCGIMNIGFGVVIFTPMLSAFTYLYSNWFTIGLTMFIALLAGIMWALSSFASWANAR